MVGGRPHRTRAGRQRGQRLLHDHRQPRRLEGGEGEGEIEPELQLVIVAVVGGQPLGAVDPRLAEQQPRGRVALGDLPPPAVDAVRLRAVEVVDRAQAERAVERIVAGGRRVVAQFGVLVQAVGHVDPEPGHPALEPELQDVAELLVDRGLPPVQVRLARQEVVQVVLAAVVPLPGGPAGEVEPVVRRPAVRSRIGPYVVVAVRGIPARRGVDEPGMRGAGVVRHQVEQDPQAPPAGLGDQLVQVGQRAKLGVDAGVVADVIAPVLVRRGHGGGQPDGVHPEPGKVVQALDDAAQVAVPVIVAITPGPHVQLIDDGTVPPRRVRPQSPKSPKIPKRPRNLRSAHCPPNPY